MMKPAQIFFVGVVIGSIIGTAIQDISTMKMTMRYKSEMEACERSLPRDQHCRIVALPVSVD